MAGTGNIIAVPGSTPPTIDSSVLNGVPGVSGGGASNIGGIASGAGSLLGGILQLINGSNAGKGAAAGENQTLNALLPIINSISGVYGSSVAPGLQQLISLLGGSSGAGNTALTQGASGGGVGAGGAGATQAMNTLLNASPLPPAVMNSLMGSAVSGADRNISDASQALAGGPNSNAAVKDVAENAQQGIFQTISNLGSSAAQQQTANQSAGAGIGTALSGQGISSGADLISQLISALGTGQQPLSTATNSLGNIFNAYAGAGQGAQQQQQSGIGGLLGGITSILPFLGL